MEAAVAGVTVGAVLLVLAGLAKVRRPRGASRALAQLGWPSSPRLVRVGGLGEVLVGAAALAVGGRPALGLVAVAYTGFTAFLVAAMARATTVGTCGCLGGDDTHPTVAHLVLTTAVAAAATAAAVADARAGIPWVLDGGRVAGAGLVAGLGIATWLAVAALTLLARVRVTR